MKKTIRKVLDELAKDTPDLSYMRGLLEGLVDEEEKIAPVSAYAPFVYSLPPQYGNPAVGIPPTTDPLADGEVTLEQLEAKTREMVAKNPSITKPLEQ